MKTMAVVIVTWNALDATIRCFESLNLETFGDRVEVIVVDNGSSESMVRWLRLQRGVTLIENTENLGYSRAVNIGIKAANPDADIVLLNNDVQVIDPEWLVKLQDAASSDPLYGIIGVKILRPNGTLQHCGAYLPLDTFWGQQVASNEVDVGQFGGLHEVESVVFAAALIKRSTIESIGLLSEEFFAYFEDTDYCQRARENGIKVGMCGDVVVRHWENTSTKANGLSHRSVFLESQRVFKEKWGPTLTEKRYSYSVDWHSISNFPTGYATSSKQLMEAMDRGGGSVRYNYVYGPGTVFPLEESPHSDSYLVNMFRSRPFGEAPVQVVYGQGDVFHRNSGKFKVGFTMLEVDGVPADWVKQANMMDEVWVPSSFNKETFQESGVRIPIRVVPLGINPAYFSPSIRGARNEDYFTFLSVFEWGERKAPEILLRAFSDEFRHDENVRLVCKINNFDGEVNLRSEVEGLNLRKNGGKIFISENNILQGYELGVLYRSADCFVLPSRGEGWGMPILEAMACGLPVIATKWSSQVDFMDTSNSLQLEVERMIPAVAKCPYYEGFRWAEPSYDHLRTLMRWVYENQDAAKDLGRVAASDASRLWTWDESAVKIRELLAEK